ncbi:MAG: transcription termination factor NusA [Alistipes sp.]|nr:transcription termination factor NusA [Alistipes sp.]
MDNLNLVSTFAEFKELKNIDKSTMIGVLEDVFRHLLIKTYETDENFDVIINPEKGDLEIWRNRTIVEDGAVENPNQQIAVSDARKIDATYEVGEEVAEEIKLSDFGRRAVLSLRQNLASRIMDLEKANLFNKCTEKVGEIITGEVYQVWKKEILVLDDEENELKLPKAEQIPSDFFRKGDSIKAIVARVEMKNNNPEIILSRTAPEFLQRLFEMEVPEIFDGLITIKKIVRIPGERAKVAVESYDERIDPVGACVGMKGSRIYSIVKELRNENIDVVNYTPNTQLFIQRALNPAKISSITLDEEKKTASIYLKPEEVSLAIGKGGLNIRLASMLTGYDIDVYREIDEADEPIDQFKGRVDDWILERLKSIGCDTVKSVLEQSIDEIAQRADLELETVQELVRILRSEEEDVELDDFSDEIDQETINKIKALGYTTAKSVLEVPVEELSRRSGLSSQKIDQVCDILRQEFE